MLKAPINKILLSFTKKTLSLCERWDGHLERALRKKNFNDVEQWTLQVTIHFFSLILKYGIKDCKSCNWWSNENSLLKFPGIVENSFRYKSWNFGEKISVGCLEIAFCPVGRFWGTCYTSVFLGWNNYGLQHVNKQTTSSNSCSVQFKSLFNTP